MATSNKQRACVYEGCTLCGSFRIPGEFGYYCKKHAPENAVDVTHSMCETEGCTHHATFGTTHAVSCKAHSCAGMVNLRSTICHDCDKLASYNFAGKKWGKFCVAHAEEGMVSVLGKRCPCGTRASFGLTRKGPVLFCKTCKPSNAVSVDKRTCIHPDGCTTRATYGPVGEKPIYCAGHKVEGMTTGASGKCVVCGKVATYGDAGGPATHCGKCANPDMIDVRHKRCKCGEHRPSFALPGDKATHCSDCCTEGMVDVVNIKCAYPGCRKRPTFGKDRATYCSTHKNSGDTSIHSNMCGVCKLKHAGFGFACDGKKVACRDHALPGMVIIGARKCVGCDSQPCKGFPGELQPTHCAKCAEDGMKTLKIAICKYCDKCAYYGLPGSGKKVCAEHKYRLPNSLPLPNKRCISDGCRELALYGPMCNRRYCEEHKEPGDLNHVERPCKSCKLAEILNDAGLCRSCAPETFARAFLAKQEAVRMALTRRMKSYQDDLHSYDTMIDGGALGRERPDFVFRRGNRIVILEVDENQHRGYPCECEIGRMITIANMLRQPVTFIRYNPDEYTGNVRDSRRLDVLVRVLEEQLAGEGTAIVDVIYLFYNNYTVPATIPLLLMWKPAQE